MKPHVWDHTMGVFKYEIGMFFLFHIIILGMITSSLVYFGKLNSGW